MECRIAKYCLSPVKKEVLNELRVKRLPVAEHNTHVGHLVKTEQEKLGNWKPSGIIEPSVHPNAFQWAQIFKDAAQWLA